MENRTIYHRIRIIFSYITFASLLIIPFSILLQARIKGRLPSLLLYMITILMTLAGCTLAYCQKNKHIFYSICLPLSFVLYATATISQLGYFDFGVIVKQNVGIDWLNLEWWYRNTDTSILGGIRSCWNYAPPLRISKIRYTGKLLVLGNLCSFVPFGLAVIFKSARKKSTVFWSIFLVTFIMLTELCQPILGIGYGDFSSILLRLAGYFCGLCVGRCKTHYTKTATSNIGRQTK